VLTSGGDLGPRHVPKSLIDDVRWLFRSFT